MLGKKKSKICSVQQQQSKEMDINRALRTLQEAFSLQFDQDIVADVLASHNNNVNAATETLLTLANENVEDTVRFNAFSISDSQRTRTAANVSENTLRRQEMNYKHQFVSHGMPKLNGGSQSWPNGESYEWMSSAASNITSSKALELKNTATSVDLDQRAFAMTNNSTQPSDVCKNEYRTSSNILQINPTEVDYRNDFKLKKLSSPNTPNVFSYINVQPTVSAMNSLIVSKPFEHLMRIIQDKILKHVPLLIILRGLPGSGKSTLANVLKYSGVVFSTDDYFSLRGQYYYEPQKLSEAHEWNKRRTKTALENSRSPVIIDNTNTEAWEMKPYIQMGQSFNYDIEILEPNTSWKFRPRELAVRNCHGVPKDKIERMLEKYQRNLTVKNILQVPELKLTAQVESTVSRLEILNTVVTNSMDSECEFGDENPLLSTPMLDENVSLKRNEMEPDKYLENLQVHNALQSLNSTLTINEYSETKDMNKEFQETCSATSDKLSISSVWDIQDEFDWTENDTPALLLTGQSFPDYAPQPQRRKTKSMAEVKSDEDFEDCSKPCLSKEEININDNAEGVKMFTDENSEECSKPCLNKKEMNNDDYAEEIKMFTDIVSDGEIEKISDLKFTMPSAEEIEDLAKSLEALVANDHTSGSGNAVTSKMGSGEKAIVPKDEVATLRGCFPLVSEDCIKRLLEECNGDVHRVSSILLVPSIAKSELNSIATSVKFPDEGNIQTSTEIIGSIISIYKNDIETLNHSVNKEHLISNENSNVQTKENGLQSQQPISRSCRRYDHSYILQLEPEFVQQLEQMFGSIGSANTSGTSSAEKLQVCVDIDLARQLHKSLSKSQNLLHNDSMKNSDNSVLPRPFNYKSSLEQCQVRPDKFPKFSSRKHQSNQSNHMFHNQNHQHIANQWQYCEMDLATKLRKQQLEEYFPGIPQESRDEIFFANNCNLSDAVNWLLSDKHEEFSEVEHQMLKAVKMDSMRHEGVEEPVVAAVDETCENFIDESDSDYENEDLVEDNIFNAAFHDEIRTYQQIRKEYFRKAQEAYQNGISGAAVYYSQQGHLYTSKIKEVSVKANRQMFAKNNTNEDANTLDLHMLFVRDAIEFLCKFLEKKKEQMKENNLKILTVDIITGKGNHSIRGIPKIKLSVLDYLRQHDYIYYEKNPGLIQVTLS